MKLKEIIFKDKRVIEELSRIKASYKEVEIYWEEVVAYFNQLQANDIYDSGIIPSLKRRADNSIYYLFNFSSSDDVLKQYKSINFIYNFLSPMFNNPAYNKANIFQVMKNATSWELENKDNIERFLSSFFINNNFNKDLFIFGEFGSGKTYFSSAIVNELVAKNKRVAFINTIKACQYLRQDRSKESEFIEDLIDIDLLIIDDLGKEPTNKYYSWFSLEVIYSILIGRQISGKKTLINSNLTIDKYLSLIQQTEVLSNSYGIVDRMREYFKNNTISIIANGNIRKEQ
ncbi:ATP-binding protein [Mycoplasma phocimorsus]|uniref:ATP-binding protein n=1 Tax=Mycoplasma phocimorsus TaxID=3045839 RepID=A0AAJ1PST9_9MOLU|nr:ATP-binding protein [Mycoplasma phocimorsus]MDJ1645896.1 ATP-binding protein [Mycoplasma phocimorsus]MDJ1646637.1 ATP-binding protein [Mycoplasma phocimorsus]MDJ1647315.1 ATP-binding protein [Mycoplasma phocimorsus]MDJ1647590.1 ATP-binding protein [Mycoplasma phocimorsus]MDJ1648066.1 ATP-binding protein [Mycoplasma phocimorsus]